MTWLRGQATQSTLVDTLTKLIVGEIADGVGNTAAVGDKWSRPIVGQDWLIPPAAEKIALPAMSFRAGYFLNNPAQFADSLGDTFLRQTAICSTTPTGSPTRWHIVGRVKTANSVAGNYSTATVTLMLLNTDTDAQLIGASDFIPAADGTITPGASWGTPTLKVGAPSGILTANVNLWNYIRHYSTTYVGGVDFWPMLLRQWPTESSVFSVAPPGVAGTDYVADVSVPAGVSGSGGGGERPSGGFRFGLGIKTNTALTGALYTLTHNVWPMSLRLYGNGTNYITAALNGGHGQYPVDSVYRRIHGRTISQWLRPFTGSPLASSPVQYWLSVKSDRVIIILNGDPGVGGVLTAAALYKFTPGDTNDLFPWAATGQTVNYQADQTNEGMAVPTRFFPLIAEQAAVNGYRMPTGRDWATGWGRPDIAMPTYTAQYQADDQAGNEGGLSNGQAFGSQSAPNPTNATYPGLMNVGAFMRNDQGNAVATASAFPAVESKPHPGDGKWWLYGSVYYDQTGSNDTGNQAANVKDDLHYRGKLTDKFFYIPGVGWSSGDELTDTGTGKTYFLVAPDYVGAGMPRYRTTTNTWAGGVAIEEA